MSTHTSTVQIDLPAARLWAYLSDVENLPDYLPQMSSAHRTGGDTVNVTAQINPSDQPAREVEGEAWFTVKEEGRTLTWGSKGPNNYEGQLDIDAVSDSACELTVRINSERAQSDDVEAGVQRTAEGIKQAAESKGR
ncbi:MAG: SRPBCC family protein [Ornithinimicrobium sp.]